MPSVQYQALHVTSLMRVVQTQVSETEYSLLEAFARSRKSTIEDVVREAIRQLTIRDEIRPDDPLFKSFPLTNKKSRNPDASEKSDLYLYCRDR